MATAREWIRSNRWWIFAVTALAVAVIAGIMMWQFWPAASGKAGRSRPIASVSDRKGAPEATEQKPAPVKSSDPLQTPGPDAAVSVAKSQPAETMSAAESPVGAGATSASVKTGSAQPIAVGSDGRAAVLDVQSIMALQRDHAQRRLYDRVAGLSASVIRSMPALGMASPSAARNDSALGTLLGGAAVAAGAAPIPSGAPSGTGTTPTGPSTAASSAGVGRLVSVYSRGDVQVAEVRLSSGRRIDLEVDDVFLGRNVIAIADGGITVTTTDHRKRSQFVALGQAFPHPE